MTPQKEKELLDELQARLTHKEWHWLQHNVLFTAPELDSASSAQIIELFPGGSEQDPPAINDGLLIKTYIWQCLLKVMAGLLHPVRGNIRSFWYQFLETFYRAHDLVPQASERWDRGDGPADAVIETMTACFTRFVQNRIFWYRGAFLFQEPIESKKKRGVDRPGILFFTEKEGLWWLCEELYKVAKRSVSVMASNGQTSLLNMEYYAVELSSKTWKLRIGAMCDFDPWGLQIAAQVDAKLRFLLQWLAEEEGRRTGRTPKVEVKTWLLTTPDLFTPAQVAAGRDYSRYLGPIPPGAKDGSVYTLVQNWVKLTGGVEGKAIGLHVDVVNEDLKRKRAHGFVDTLISGKEPKLPVIHPEDFQAWTELE